MECTATRFSSATADFYQGIQTRLRMNVRFGAKHRQFLEVSLCTITHYELQVYLTESSYKLK